MKNKLAIVLVIIVVATFAAFAIIVKRPARTTVSSAILLTDTPIGSKALKFVHNDDGTLMVILTETGRNPVVYATYDVLDTTETAKAAQFFADNFPVE